MSRVFISHSSLNNDKAVEVRNWLTGNGWDDVFLDLDPERGIAAGQRWKEALQKAAYRCELVIALVSPEWLSSSWCKSELDAARLMGKKVIALLVGIDKSQVPQDLTDEQFIDLTGDPQAYKRLKEGLKRAGLDPTSFVFEPGRRPYPGFASFEEQDAAVFFGRDAQIICGLDEIRRIVRTGVARLLCILGASGSGKSSFLRAGLWPRLKRDDLTWLPLPVVRPERAALSGKWGLAQALQQIIGEPRFSGKILMRGLPRSRPEIQDLVEKSDDGLIRLLTALRDIARSQAASDTAPPPTVVIAIDQGEELFNDEGREEAKRFIDILTRALNADPHLLVILVTRSDAFPLLQGEAALAALPKDIFTLDIMLEGSYREVIEGPARLVEPPLRIDPLLVDALLEDISGQDALPLLAFTLAHLYEDYAADGALTLAGYEKIGRVKGVIDKTVVQAFAEGSAPGGAPGDRTGQLGLARSAFIPHLAQVNAAGQFVRRVATLEQIPVEARPLIDRFAHLRLLIRDRRRGVEVVEVAHEALLRQPPFCDWLMADREFLVWRERLSQTRAGYEANQRGLLTGRELAIARNYLQTRTEREIDPLDSRFVRDSIAEDDKRLAEEAEQARAKAAAERSEQERRIRDAEQLAAEQKKAAVASRRFARIAVLVALVTLVGAIGIILEYRRATTATQLATVREWAAQARTEAGTPHGLLLGLNSIALAEQIDDARPIESIQLLDDLLSVTGGLPLRHQDMVAAVTFAGDDRWLVTASSGDIVFHNPQAPFDLPRIMPGKAKIAKTAVSADGRWLAAAAGNDVRLFDMTVPDPIVRVHALSGHSGPIKDLAFSPDNRTLATASDDGTVRLWSIDTEQGTAEAAIKASILRHERGSAVHTLAFQPDGRVLATATKSRIRIWNLQEPSAPPKLIYQYAAADRDYVDIIKVAFSPDAQWLIAGATENYHALLFRAPFDQPPFSFHVNQWVGAVSFSPDNRWLVVPDHYNALVLDLTRENPTSEPLVLRGHTDAITDLTFSRDGSWFATASADRSVQLWNPADRFSGPAVLKGHEGPIASLAFSRDGALLATASNDRTVRLWNVSSPFGEPLWLHAPSDPTRLHLWDVRAPPRPRVLQVVGDELGVGAGRVTSPNGKWLATLSNPASVVHLTDLTQSPPAEHILRHDAMASPVFSPDGHWLATGGWSDAMIRLWDLTVPEPESNPMLLHGHGGRIRSLAFSADGHRLVSGADDTLAMVWDLTAPDPSAKPLVLPGGDGRSIVRTVAISPDGRHVLTGSWEPDYAARIWDLSLPDPGVRPIKLNFENRVFDSAFSPDGHWAAAASWDQTTQLVDLTRPDAAPLALRGHTGRTLSVAFSPDNRWLATGNDDRTIRLWSLAAADAIANSIRLTAPVGLGVAFSPDGHTLALSQTEYRSNPFSRDGSQVASTDADIQLYDVDLKDLKALACRVAGRNLTADEIARRSAYPLNASICPPQP
jgi:WD40 repeat protein